MCCEPRQISGLHLLQPGIRQSHGVYHSLIELRDARRRIPDTRLDGNGLRREPANSLEIDDLCQLGAVAGSARSENDWVLKGDAGDDGG